MIVLFGLLLAAVVAAVMIGIWEMCRGSVIELHDTFMPDGENGSKLLQRGILQLQNELAGSGAVKFEKLSDGEVRVSIKVVV